MQPVLHDGDELSIAELAVSVLIKQGKHSVDQVFAEAGACADLDCSVKLICKHYNSLYTTYRTKGLAIPSPGAYLAPYSSSE